jgi:hypothetical protein
MAMTCLRPACLVLLSGLAGCASLAPVEQNAAQLAALPPAATCDARLPFFGYYRYARDEMQQYAEPDASIAMGNDGGWCSIAYQAQMPNGAPTVADASVTRPPGHGEAMVGTLNGLLRIAYRPAPGFTGPDAFTVSLHGPLPYTVPVRVVVAGR